MVELYGTTGRDWLQRLPATIAACEQRWSLRVMSPFEPLSYNLHNHAKILAELRG